METSPYKKISKRLSYVLRHNPDSIGVQMDGRGWVVVTELLEAFENSGKTITLKTLNQVVESNDKQRFEFSDGGTKIRARQGHSTEVELGYEPSVPPDQLFHGTATQNVDSIMANGLNKANRHHVHLSTNRQTMLQVATRHGQPVLLSVDAKKMHADGFDFFVTGNQVWLTDHVPPKYLSIVDPCCSE